MGTGSYMASWLHWENHGVFCSVESGPPCRQFRMLSSSSFIRERLSFLGPLMILLIVCRTWLLGFWLLTAFDALGWKERSAVVKAYILEGKM